MKKILGLALCLALAGCKNPDGKTVQYGGPEQAAASCAAQGGSLKSYEARTSTWGDFTCYQSCDQTAR